MATPLPSNLDFEQCIRGAFDDSTATLRTSAQITGPVDMNGEVLVDIRASDGDSALLYGTQDGTDTGTIQVLKVNSDGSLNVNAVVTIPSSIEADQGTPNTIANAWPTKITDGTNTVIVNPDGSLNVSTIPSSNHVVISNFNSISSVASSILTTILSYTVPISKVSYLEIIEYSGSNIGTYDVYINSILSARQRTNFGGPMGGIIPFKTSTSDIGLELESGDLVEIKVIHERPYVGDFEARLLTVEG